MNASDKLSKMMLLQNTLCCCGLDPDISKFPPEIVKNYRLNDEEKVFSFLKEVIDITMPNICAFKAQKAFFDCLDGGHVVLKEIIKYVHTKFSEIPVIVDCKIGETKNTMKTYTDNLFIKLEADGIVVNPYMGDDVFESLIDFPEKMIVVLVRTSNPGANIIQDITTSSGKKLWEVVLGYVVERWNVSENMVPVISATAQIDLSIVRKIIPDNMNILFAGVGEQGGDEGGINKLLNSKKNGVFVNSSRGILYKHLKDGQRWQDAVKEEVIRLQNVLNKYREE